MKTLLKGATLFNEGKSLIADILIDNQRIEKIDSNISATPETKVVNLEDKVDSDSHVENNVADDSCKALAYNVEDASDSRLLHEAYS